MLHRDTKPSDAAGDNVEARMQVATAQSRASDICEWELSTAWVEARYSRRAW
jgi:hypothetical protein